MAVSVDYAGPVALVTINNPPVNAASHRVREGLLEALAQTEGDSDVRAVVLRGAGATFTAGADVTEFDKPPLVPHLPDIVSALEAATKPWVAALHGTVLGGGLEIALGCHGRVAASGTKIGLPEVTLGLIPGAGGTVRLPRLVDPIEALTMITSGKPITADRACEIGLIDKVADGDVTEAAVALANTYAKAALPEPLSRRAPVAIGDQATWDAAKERIVSKANGNRAPQVAVEAVQNALDLPARDALARERELFLSLKSGPQCAALRRLFFAERSAAKLLELEGASPRALDHIGVVGGGTMGAGIAAACLLAGLPVTMIERDDDSAAAGQKRVLSVLDNSRNRGVIDDKQHEIMTTRFSASSDYADLSDADLVIEAVFEDRDVKVAVFTALDEVLAPDAVIASNTSYLDINELAAATIRPERVIGLHFFSPAYVMKLVEVIVTERARPEALATGFALAKRLRKIAVPAGVCDGFIGNRIMSAYRKACEFMVEDGAWPWDVDAAMRAFGFPMGIFEMQDLAGLDISWAMRKRKAATRSPSERYVALGDTLCEAGRFGRKSGAGWYDYEDGRAQPSAFVESVITAERERKGIQPVSLSQDEIIERIMLTMQDEAQDILNEGIARRPEDIDVVMVNGYGFPRWRGGPMFMAQQSEG